MLFASQVKRFFGDLFRWDRVEHSLDAELRTYVDELTDRKIAGGTPREEARRQALVELGGLEQIKEDVRETRPGIGLESAFLDLRYSVRSLLRSPGFTAILIVTLALGIGANLTMFSLMRAVLWRPLPYPEPNRIVVIQADARNVTNAGATRAEFLGIRDRSRSFEHVSTIDTGDGDLEYGGQVDHIVAANVSDDFLRLLGVRPALGRMLDSRTDQSGQQPLAVLISDELWRRRFSADPGVVGRGVRIDDVDLQIEGVLPPGFRLFLPPSVNDQEQIDIWEPYRIDATLPYRGVPIVARLRPGVTLQQANTELQMLASQFERDLPDLYSGAKAWQASPFDRRPGASVRFTARLLHDDMTR
ncbi:MAG TPA: ABC transporter permease, partial [Bryobacteraceae bacterium]